MGTKDVATTEPKNNLPASMADLDFSEMPAAEASDFKIPVLTIIQPTSQLDGTVGDVVDSNTKQKIFGENDTFKFVPLWFYKDFAVYEWNNGQRGKYLRREARGPHNMAFEKFDNRIQKDAETGRDVIYMLRNCFFVIAESELNSPFPQIFLLRYKGAGISESKNLIMTWERCRQLKIPPFSMVMQVVPKMEKNDKGKYIVLRTNAVNENNKAKQVEGKQLETAYQWYKMIASNQESYTSKVGEDIESDTPQQENFQEGKLNY